MLAALAVTAVLIAAGCVPDPPGGSFRSMWADDQALYDAPESGAAWSGPNGVKTIADSAKPSPCLTGQASTHNIWTLANAIVWRATGNNTYFLKADGGVQDVIGDHTDPCGGTGQGRALEIGRNLTAYNIVVDMTNLPSRDSTTWFNYASWIGTVEGYHFPGSPGSGTLRDCFRVRPDNWGVHCASAQLTIDELQGDTSGMNDIYQVFGRYTGNTGVPDTGGLSFDYSTGVNWSTTPSDPRGVNLPGTIPGTSINGDGYIVRDVSRTAATPPSSGTCPQTPIDSHWGGGWSGTMILTELLQRAYDAGMFNSNVYYSSIGAPKDATYQAVLRASQGLQRVDANCDGNALGGDDEYARYLVDNLYPSANFPVVSGSVPGKVMAFAQFTHP